MTATAALRDEIRKTFFPFAAEKGFTRDKGSSLFFTFRKVNDSGGYVFDIQFEKYQKPRFVVNLGSCGADGVTLGARHIAASDIQPSDTPNYARLKPGAGGGTDSWFRQDRGFLQSLLTLKRLDDPAAPVAQLIKLFTEVEEYFQTGTAGPHIYRLAPPQK